LPLKTTVMLVSQFLRGKPGPNPRGKPDPKPSTKRKRTETEVETPSLRRLKKKSRFVLYFLLYVLALQGLHLIVYDSVFTCI
jgi:hypothetical protein